MFIREETWRQEKVKKYRPAKNMLTAQPIKIARARPIDGFHTLAQSVEIIIALGLLVRSALQK
jgi:hypothetical protein